ncbi:TetR/AcrR family transcriptional regulator [Amycolatopsis viridis]|uniref:AcrR family transcriptional regulator n=1 Tax=Amycolatopsis viridis TaxID=185678 RepID=A0ABX0SW20_9PSEU|nr:TetR/AcrR family transcriptional regulator [Amycolatopsis viridis]NIH79859.1 AcrR family transcriptional regulator [Amycolatopsis viridis]
MEPTSLRTYGGVAGEDRRAERRAQLLEAGLELLGAREGDRNLTVRGVCRRAGLAARYFYENFADRNALAVAVHDRVVEGIAATTLDAVQNAPGDARAKTHAGLSRLVRTIAEDPRTGFLLFSPALHDTVLAERRAAAARWFAALLGLQAREFYGMPSTARLDLFAEMLVGGLSQALTSWLEGTLPLSEEDLVEHCTEVFLAVSRIAGTAG